ncbi:hypothetical protein [Microcella alkalica]|uniref:hypothetical protein n=1 Tax=Microcella alkalica TaxID=355930 RepID=UPI00145DC963|nr:hypothetical protein [Microcella alkalica]
MAPLNYAGQAYEWCRALERADGQTVAQNAMVRTRSDFHHMADYEVPVAAYAASGPWHRRWSDHVLSHATHVIVEGQKQPLGSILTETTEQQVRRLQATGIHVAMLCHGSDIRLPSRHAALEADSPFADPQHASTRRLERAAMQNAALLDRLQLPVFVSTPDLLLDVPRATWLPVVIQPERWHTDAAPFERERPVVVHAPSSGWLKGTDLIDETMSRLHDEGLIEYRRLRGLPHSAMREAYGSADVVLDQFRLGGYGVAAVEALAAGRLVIGWVTDQVRRSVRDTTGRELPIVSVRASRLESSIRSLLADREAARARAAAGPAFVRAVHDGTLSASVLQPFLAGSR